MVSEDVGSLPAPRTTCASWSPAVRASSGRTRPWSPWPPRSAGKPAVIVGVNEAARELGIKAGALAKTAAGILGGGGGGRDDLAQGGGIGPHGDPRGARGAVAFRPPR